MSRKNHKSHVAYSLSDENWTSQKRMYNNFFFFFFKMLSLWSKNSAEILPKVSDSLFNHSWFKENHCWGCQWASLPSELVITSIITSLNVNTDRFVIFSNAKQRQEEHSKALQIYYWIPDRNNPNQSTSFFYTNIYTSPIWILQQSVLSFYCFSC